MRIISISFFIIILFIEKSIGQAVISDTFHPDKLSLFSYSTILSTGKDYISLDQIRSKKDSIGFKKLKNEIENIGFTDQHYWVRSSIVNNSSNLKEYFLEIARPVTDHVDLYLIDGYNKITEYHSGDDMPYKNRNYDHRKSIFKLAFKAKTHYELYIHLKSDGEVISLPIVLRSEDNLLHITYLEQLVFGFFYGVLLLAAIIYMFFYFGMKDNSFKYYSLYVVFIGLMQFSLDGYFYEYCTPGGGWVSLHAVLLFASAASFLLGKYTELYLNIPNYIPFLSKIYKIIFGFIGISTIFLFFIPSFLKYGYILANVYGLTILLIIVFAISYLYVKRLPIDKFFTIGIFFLIAGFVIFILNNFNLIPNSFLSQNSSKLGTGMEVIFISLSMANRIRKLREDREQLIINLTNSNQDLRQFTYITSHNLRAPIANIMGLVSLYDKSKIAEPKNRLLLEKIEESTMKLNETVTDLVSILLIKNDPEVEQVSISFNHSLKIAIASIENDIISSGATIEANFSGAESIFFNKNYLESIFLNLLTNSLKYKSESRPLIIKIHSEVKDHITKLIYSDNGSGINLERHKDKIFGMHQRFHNNKNSKGVGLYIIKSQIVSLGGTIEIESKEDEGTAFTICFKKNVSE
ncbi:MAG: hybrid sensor histidine kinase/response regulator [Ginsengibacter sp.]